MQIMFNSGVVANIIVNPATGDIAEIIFDKYMVGKLLSEYVGDGRFIFYFYTCYILFKEHEQKYFNVCHDLSEFILTLISSSNGNCVQHTMKMAIVGLVQHEMD